MLSTCGSTSTSPKATRSSPASAGSMTRILSPAPLPASRMAAGFNTGDQSCEILSVRLCLDPRLFPEHDQRGAGRGEPPSHLTLRPGGQPKPASLPNTEFRASRRRRKTAACRKSHFSGLSTLGSNAYLPSNEVSDTLQITDDFTKTYGQHAFKMGIEFQNVKFSTLQPAYSRGNFDYGNNSSSVTFTDIPNVGGGATGRAQFLLTPDCDDGSQWS